MTDQYTLALMITAATVGSLHSLAPDHWVPFAALARARGWNPARTSRLAFFCALGHVTVSALFGILAVLLGREAVEAFGTTMAASAPLLLIGFGAAYLVWALWRISRRKIMHHVDHLDGRPHDHGHGHHHQHRGKGLTEWGLFFLFSADPCVALIPMIIAASAKGWSAVGAVIVVYEIATIAAIVTLVRLAHAGARKLQFGWVDRYGDLVAGALMISVGAFVTFVGI
jgi:threonine/homoserine/homoserine lactone efflux protein